MKIQNTKGLSLIEILIVLAILGIVGAIGSYNFQQYKYNANLRTMARELQSDIAKTKQRAVSQGVCYYMTVGTISYTIGLDGAVACKTPPTPVPAFSSSTTKSLASLDLEGAGLIISNDYGNNTIRFETRGTIFEAGNVVILNSRLSNATITSNVTGKTYVTFNMQ